MFLFTTLFVHSVAFGRAVDGPGDHFVVLSGGCYLRESHGGLLDPDARHRHIGHLHRHARGHRHGFSLRRYSVFIVIFSLSSKRKRVLVVVSRTFAKVARFFFFLRSVCRDGAAFLFFPQRELGAHRGRLPTPVLRSVRFHQDRLATVCSLHFPDCHVRLRFDQHVYCDVVVVRE